MKKTYLLMLFLLVSASASAEWSHFSETRRTHFYVDNASTQAVDGIGSNSTCTRQS